MRSMVEGADTSLAPALCPLHRLRRSPSPASRVRNPSPASRLYATHPQPLYVTRRMKRLAQCKSSVTKTMMMTR